MGYDSILGVAGQRAHEWRVLGKTSEVYREREVPWILCGVAVYCGSRYPFEDFRSLVGGLLQRAGEDVLYLNSDLWYNWPRFDWNEEMIGAHAKVKRIPRKGRFGSRLPE